MPAVAIVDATTHAYAAGFYEYFGQEPILPSGVLKVAGLVRMKGMSGLTLLQKAANVSPESGGELVVVCHGLVTEAKGLGLPLVAGNKWSMSGEVIDVLLTALDERAGKGPGVAERLSLTEASLSLLLKSVRTLHARTLARVELRACDVASSPAALDSLRRLFGARLLTAPVDTDVFGFIAYPSSLDPRSYDAELKKLKAKVKSEPQKYHLQTYGRGDLRVAFLLEIGDGRLGGNRTGFGTFRAASREALDTWSKRNYGKAAPTRSPLLYHAFFTGTEVVYPADPAYRDQLRLSSASASETRENPMEAPR